MPWGLHPVAVRVALSRVPLQVLGREGPFPLILLPQFGGYWIEGTNHEITSVPETEPLQSPTTKVKLECNPTARVYRKHFLGKVGGQPVLGPGWGCHSPASWEDGPRKSALRRGPVAVPES